MNGEDIKAVERLLESHIGWVREGIKNVREDIHKLDTKLDAVCERASQNRVLAESNRAWVKALYWVLGGTGGVIALLWRIGIFRG